MGIYLNSHSAYGLFCRDYASTYFVDKSDILKDLIPLVEMDNDELNDTDLAQKKGQKYVSITRPRRFGKTVIANMIASYFGKGIDSSKAFDHLRLSQHPLYQQHLNKHNVIHIMFNEVPDEITSYEEYSRMIKNTLTTQCNMLCVVRVFSNVTIICLYARIGFSPSAN